MAYLAHIMNRKKRKLHGYVLHWTIRWAALWREQGRSPVHLTYAHTEPPRSGVLPCPLDTGPYGRRTWCTRCGPPRDVERPLLRSPPGRTRSGAAGPLAHQESGCQLFAVRTDGSRLAVGIEQPFETTRVRVGVGARRDRPGLTPTETGEGRPLSTFLRREGGHGLLWIMKGPPLSRRCNG